MVKLEIGDFKEGQPMVKIMRGDELIGAIYSLTDNSIHIVTHGRIVAKEQGSLETLCIIEGRESSDLIVALQPKSGVFG